MKIHFKLDEKPIPSRARHFVNNPWRIFNFIPIALFIISVKIEYRIKEKQTRIIVPFTYQLYRPEKLGKI